MLSLVEQGVLMYRTLVTIPCWLFYFQSIGMGDVLTSCMNGAALCTCSLLAFLSMLLAKGQGTGRRPANKIYAGVYLWFKARILFLEVTAAYACVRAIVRRQFVYGHLVAATDPQLMEGGRTCPICQVKGTARIGLQVFLF